MVAVSDPLGVAAAAETPDPVEPIQWVDANRAQQRAAAGRYVRARRVYVLVFEAPDLAQLEIRARSVSVGKFLKLVKLAARLDRDAASLSAEDAEAIEGLFTGFAEALISWNIDDPDTEAPVPATYDGVMAQDTDFMMVVIDAWLTAVGGVDAPLGATSTSGPRSLEASIPMVDPSPSL